MKTITICGSMRYEREMRRIALALEIKHGYNVLQCIYSEGRSAWSPAELAALRAAHFKKIDLSDAIYVVDIQGYIGEAAKAEIAYAQANRKEVILHSGFAL